MKRYVEFKAKEWGDDWNAYPKGRFAFLDHAAEHIAEEHWSSDPSDPNKFDFEIEIRFSGETKSQKFRVLAEAEVIFRVYEVT